MSAIEVTGQYLVRSGRTITVTGSEAFVMDNSVAGKSPYLINDGTVRVIGSGSVGGVVGVETTYNHLSGRGVLNEAGGVFSITSNIQDENVRGFHLTAGAFTNNGEVAVASQLSYAQGVFNEADMVFSNAGTFQVTGVGALGVYDANGGSFSNTGRFIVDGGADSATGAELGSGYEQSNHAVNAGEMDISGQNAIGFTFEGGAASLDNSGTLLATGTQASPWSIGVLMSFAEYSTFQVTNSGHIQAFYAIREYDDASGGDSTIINTGTGEIRGQLELNYGVDNLTNAGKIIGDVLLGSGSDTYLTQGNGSLSGAVYGGVGADTLTGGKHVDILWGDSTTAVNGDRGDLLSGASGADKLYGGGGNDTLVGGQGADRLDVGTGSDLLVYKALTDSKVSAPDHVVGLASGDRIDLSALDADTTQKGNQAFTLAGALDGHAGQAAMVYDPTAHTTALLLDVNGDGAADFKAVFDGDVHGFTGFVL